jgi:hypothetical protein
MILQYEFERQAVLRRNENNCLSVLVDLQSNVRHHADVMHRAVAARASA